MDLVTSDEIDNLRKTYSDDQILSVLKTHAPDDADEIEKLQKGGATSSQILSVYPDYAKDKHASSHPAPSGVIGTAMDIASKGAQALRYGVADEAKRAGATSEALTGTPSVASTVGNAIADPSYDPASNHVGLSMDGLSYLPRAVVESLPSQGGYLAAGAAGTAMGGPVGGLLGAGAYGLARYLGTNAQSRAANNGHAGNVTNSDLGESLLGSAGQGLLDAVGSRFLAKNALLKAAPVTGAGLAAMKQTGGNIVKTAAVNAATTGANDAVGQAGTEIGTQAGYRPDLGQSAHAAVTGGLVAGALKGIGSVPEAIMNVRQTNSDPTIRTQLADDMNSTRITGDPSNLNDNGKILKSAFSVNGNDLNQGINNFKGQAVQKAISHLQGQYDDLSSQIEVGKQQGQNITNLVAQRDSLVKQMRATPDQISNDIGPMVDYLNNLRINIKDRQLDPNQIAEAKQKLADQPDILNPLLKMNEIHNIGKQSGLKEYNAPENAPQTLGVHQLIHSAKWPLISLLSGVGAGALGHTLVGAGLLSIPALAVAARLKAGLMGDRAYVNQFAQRFGTPEGAPNGGIPGVPGQEQSAPQQGQRPQEQAAPEQGPQAPITDPRLLLNRPPIYGRGPVLPQGVHPDHFVQEPPAEPVAPEQPPQAPQGAPQQLRLPPPTPTMTTPPPQRGFSNQRGAELPSNLLMLRAALAKAAGQPAPEQAPTQPEQAQQAPAGSAVSPRARVNAQVDNNAPAKAQAKAQPKAEPVAPKEEPLTFNQQADGIEQAIKSSQDTISNPQSAPAEVAAAKASLRKSILAAAAQHDASKGGSKGVKKAVSASSEGHASHSGSAKAAHAATHATSASSGHAHGAGNSVSGEVFHVKTKHGTVTLHENSTRRNQEVQSAGIIKRVNARDEVGQAVSKLPLSAQGHAAAAAKVPELMHSVLHLSNASEARDHLNHFLGSFSAKDHEILGNHFNNFRASSGQNFLGTWKHGDEKLARAATVKNEAINKGKKTKAAKKDAENK